MHPMIAARTRDEREWAAAPHWLFFLCLAASFVLGEAGKLMFLVSLAGTAWLAWKTRYLRAFAFRHVRESLNFQITFLLALTLAVATLGYGSWMPLIAGRPTLLLALVAIGFVTAIVLSGIAATRASRGREFRYPLSLRIVR
jgi:hypothetical protein